MTSNHKTGNDPEADFSFGVRELGQANVEKEPTVTVAPLKAVAPLKLVNEKHGCDPYNSGSFDREKNWTRVGKR
jgi:hypothetical protein